VGPQNHVLDGIEIPPREWAILEVVRTIGNHCESVLWRFMQQKINNGDSGTAAAGGNTADITLSSREKSASAMRPFVRIF